MTNNIKKKRNILGLYILYYCGLRAFELLNIELKDINTASNPEFYSIETKRKELHNQGLKDGFNDAKEMEKAIQKGDWAKVGELNARNDIDLVTGGMVSKFTAQKGMVQGGSQSGVSYSHNESSNYSYGVTASGGSAFAGMAQSMGMNMQSYATMSSSVAAAGAVFGAVAAFTPAGRMAGMLSNIGAINPEGSYAMGVGSAAKLKKNQTQSGINSMGSAHSRIDTAQGELNTAKMNVKYSGGGRFDSLDQDTLNHVYESARGGLQKLEARRTKMTAQGNFDSSSPQANYLNQKIAYTRNRVNALESQRTLRRKEIDLYKANANLQDQTSFLNQNQQQAWDSSTQNPAVRQGFRSQEGLRTVDIEGQQRLKTNHSTMNYQT